MAERELPPICVDASLAVAVLLPEPTSRGAERIWHEWLADARRLLAPPHFRAETLTAIRRAGLRELVTDAAECAALELFLARVCARVEVAEASVVTLRRAWEWARTLGRANVYDTIYLAVAEESGAEFWTADENLERALAADGSPLPEWVHVVHAEPASPATP